MDADKYFDTTLNREHYYHQISTELISEKSPTEASDGYVLIAIVLTSGIAAIASVGISLYQQRSRQKSSSYFPKVFQDSTQTKCTNCDFYDSNSYLKCAVHPTKVLTKEAQECMDYEAEH